MILLYLNIPTSTTVQTIWLRKVNIRTQGQENWKRITIILIILLSGEKLSTLLIFKAKERNDIERRLQQIKWVEKKEFLYCDKKLHWIAKI